MERKVRTVYDSVVGMTKQELARFIARSHNVACRMCPYWCADEDRCCADRDYVCTADYAEALIEKYLGCPLDDDMAVLSEEVHHE